MTDHLVVDGLSVGYGAADVLTDISLAVAGGDLVALLGPNGAGKSTLLRAVSGILSPSAGRILWQGREVSSLKPYQIARLGIAHVPEGRGIFAELTVDENLALGLYAVGKRPLANKSHELREWLFGIFPRLAKRLKQQAGTMSGGEQQMLAIARALISEPDLLILDEPSLGLSPLFVEEVFRCLADLRSSGRSVLLVEQNAHAALEVAGYAYVLETGRIAIEGRADELLRTGALERAYLGGSRSSARSKGQ